MLTTMLGPQRTEGAGAETHNPEPAPQLQHKHTQGLAGEAACTGRGQAGGVSVPLSSGGRAETRNKKTQVKTEGQGQHYSRLRVGASYLRPHCSLAIPHCCAALASLPRTGNATG